MQLLETSKNGPKTVLPRVKIWTDHNRPHFDICTYLLYAIRNLHMRMRMQTWITVLEYADLVIPYIYTTTTSFWI